ncbi:hypothetical protein [Frankia sp. Cj3]|uniref:hypothetical protein n=3 Tax=unclassified Frankia TaxID=2632575 RepID=UPI001EF56762|nr:hypothetical protein [Frankia sp. Cj3]
MAIVVGSASPPSLSATGNDAPASILAIALRVCRLDRLGHISRGPNNMIVTDQFTKIDFAGEMENGIDTSLRNAAGNLAVTYRTPDLAKRLTMGLSFTAPDPELEELATGGIVLTSNDPPITAPTATVAASATGGTFPSGAQAYQVTAMNYRGETTPASPITVAVTGPTGSTTLSIPATAGASAFGVYRLIGSAYLQLAIVPAVTGGTTTFTDIGIIPSGCTPATPVVNTTGGRGTEGYAYPTLREDPTPCGVSVEAWSRAVIDGAPADPPFIHWVWPRVQLWNKGARALDTSPLMSEFTGFGFQNPYWGTGPDGTWNQDSTRVCFRRREARYPLPQIGYQSTPAPTY